MVKETVKETRLKFAAINPDQWEKMDVGLALCVFHQDTISEQALHIATGLGMVACQAQKYCQRPHI
jgi:hypothetical protein